MSERMTDRRWAKLRARALKPENYAELAREMDRARASEVEKDAQIKALADALEGHGSRGPEWHSLDCIEYGHGASCDADRAALRLVGRL